MRSMAKFLLVAMALTLVLPAGADIIYGDPSPVVVGTSRSDSSGQWEYEAAFSFLLQQDVQQFTTTNNTKPKSKFMTQILISNTLRFSS